MYTRIARSTARAVPACRRVGTRRGRSVAVEKRAVWGMKDPASTCMGSIMGPRKRKFIPCTAIMFSMMVLRISLTLR